MKKTFLILVLASLIPLGTAADLIIDGGSQTLGGLHTHDQVEVINGGRLYVQDGQKLTLNADSVYVDSSSDIYARQRGYNGGSGGSYAQICTNPSSGSEWRAYGGNAGSGTGSGSNGGDSSTYSGCASGAGGGGAGGAAYGGSAGSGGGGGGGYGGSGGSGGNTHGSKTTKDVTMGAGGGGGGAGKEKCNGLGSESIMNEGFAGGDGGGAIEIYAGSINIAGNIYADGGDGGDGGSGSGGGGSGASGGAILLDGSDVDISGNFYVDGGARGNAGANVCDRSYGPSDGSAGGGGRIKIFYGSLSDGSAYYDVGGYNSGTVYKEQENSPPNNPTNLAPSGSGVDTSPSISADVSDPDGNADTLYFETGGGSNIGSCSVSSSSGCSVTYSGANNWGTTYTFQVYAEDTAGATSGTVSETFTTNYKPTVSNLQPSGSPVQLNPQLSADVDDQDGECLTVTFRDASDNSNIGSDSVCGSGTATVSTSGDTIGSNPGTSYSFDVVVSEDDGQASTVSGDQSFTTVHKPSITSGPSPGDGANDVSTSRSLQVDVNHPDNLDMTVDFSMDGSNAGSDTVSNSGTASANPSLGYSEDHSWSVNVYTQGYSTSTSGGSWGFQTEHSTSASLSGPSKSPASIDPSLSATVSHSDSAETVTVEFVNTDNGNVFCSGSAGNGDTVTCDTSGSSFGSSPGTTYNWEVQISGDWGSESWTSGQQSFTTISNPNVNRVEPGSNSGVPTSQDLVVDVSHPDSKNMNVEFLIREAGTSSFSTVDTLTDVSGQVSANPSLDDGTDYEWRADVDTVGYSTSTLSSIWSFTTNYVPSVSGITKYDASDDHAFEDVSAIVSDQDGDDDIAAANLTVDQGGLSPVEYEHVSIDRGYGGSNEANVTFGRVNVGDGNWDLNGANLMVEGIDSGGNVGSSTVTRDFPNHAPTTDSKFSYSESPQNHAFTLNIDSEDVDNGDTEIDSCTVEHRDGEGNSYTESGSLNSGQVATCSFTIDNSYNGYEKGDIIEHRVTFTDLHGSTVTSDWASHEIPNSPPAATNLQPSGYATNYGPTLNATYNDPDGDSGNLTFYNTSSGNQIGKVTGLAPGEHGTVEWSSANQPGTEYSFTVEADDGLDTSSSVVGTYEGDNIDSATVNGKSVTYQRDKYGTWIPVLNYEHFGGENPSVAPGSTFPQIPNGLTDETLVNGLGTSGETRHVDQISQYGEWNVSAVRLDGYTENHDREIHFLTTNQNVIDAVTGTTTPSSYTDFQGSTTTLYNDHTANLPASAGSGTSDSNSDRIFGYEFPFYKSSAHHWALAARGDIWSVDDWHESPSKTTVHRVWIRVPNSTIKEYSENFTTIFEPKEPYDPDPANESTVDTTDRDDSEIAASVKVVHPDGRPMNVEFINESNGQIMEIDYNVDSGSRAQMTDIGNSLRDETNTTYEWYARSYDTGTGEYTDSGLFTFETVEVGDVMFDITKGSNSDNMDVTGQSDNGWTEIEFEITSSQMDPVPVVSVNETYSGDEIETWTDVDNNSVLTVDLEQDGGEDWNLNTDSEYEYFIEAREGPNVIGRSLNQTIYTYNVSLEWDRAEKYYNVYQYDVYRAQDTGSDLYFDYGSGDYDIVGSLPETSFNDSGPGLETGTFCWKVAASNPTGSSDAIPSGDGNCKTLN